MICMWVFPKIMVPQNGWVIRENPIKMDDLGGPPLFLETSMYRTKKFRTIWELSQVHFCIYQSFKHVSFIPECISVLQLKHKTLTFSVGSNTFLYIRHSSSL